MSDGLPKTKAEAIEELVNVEVDNASFDMVLAFYKDHVEKYYKGLNDDDLLDQYVEDFSLSEEEEVMLRLRLLDD